MILKSCFAGIDSDQIPYLTTVLSGAGLLERAAVTNMNVSDIARTSPAVIVCDVDAVVVDKLEQMRQLRFALPQAIIVVYTGRLEERWTVSCHLAGASCVLSKSSSRAELSLGILVALQTGCYTDPKFAAREIARAGRDARPAAGRSVDTSAGGAVFSVSDELDDLSIRT